MVGLVVLAVVFAVLGVLYAVGAISFLTTHPMATHHYQHAVFFAALCLASLVMASLVRPRPI